VVSRIQPRV
jgi:hypothetical protein